MFEWLTGDPLVGILTTVGFFVFLIIGHHAKLRRMNRKRALASEANVNGTPTSHEKILDARIKLICAVAAIFGVVFMIHWQTTLIILASSIALVFYSQASLKVYLKRLLYPSYIIILIAIIQPFTYGSTVLAVVPGFGLSIFQEGIWFGVLVFSRALAAVAILNLLILVTPMETIMDSLHWFKVPSVILDTMILMYRYITIISEESARMRKAQESRLGYSKYVSMFRKLANYGTLAGMLLTRAFDRAMKVGDSMISRGYTGASSLFAYSTSKLDRKDSLVGVIAVTAIISLVLIDLFIV